LHIWAVTTGVPLLGANLVIGDMGGRKVTLRSVRVALAAEHQIDHVTLQPERRTVRACEALFSFQEKPVRHWCAN